MNHRSMSSDETKVFLIQEGELNDIMKVELDEMEPVLAGLVSRIGGLNGKKAIDALARAGK